MSTVRSLLFVGMLSFIPTIVLSQSPKKYCDAAEKFEKAKNYEGAIENYSKALEMDPKFEKAYIARAACYEKINFKMEAIEDYKKALVFNPKEKEYFYNAGRLLADMGKNTEADEMLRKALERDKGYTEALAVEVKVLFELRDYTYGLKVTEMALEDKKTAQNLYNHAVMEDSLKNNVEAEKFYRSAKQSDPKFIPAYVGLALTQIELNKNEEAMKVCDEALTKDPNNSDVFLVKSLVNAAKKDYQNAINEITKVILTKPTVNAFMLRANFYTVLGQHHNAINDYSQVIRLDDKNIYAYLNRAYASEQIQNFKASLADYNKVASLANGNDKIDVIVKQAKIKIYELNKESTKPEIELTSLKADKNTIKIAADKNEIVIKGLVKDASLIKNINVNSGTGCFLYGFPEPFFQH